MAIDRQNIKAKFRSEEELPSDFSWENMEQGIHEKMNSKKSGKTTGFIYLAAIALALLIISAGIFYALNCKNEFAQNSKKIAIKAEIKSHEDKHTDNRIPLNPINQENATLSESKMITVEKTNSTITENGTNELIATYEAKTKSKYTDSRLIKNNTIRSNGNLKANNVIKNKELTSEGIVVSEKRNNTNHPPLVPYLTNVNVVDSTPASHQSETKNDKLISAENNLSTIRIANIGARLFTVIHQSEIEMPSLDIVSPLLDKKEERSFKNVFSVTGGIWQSKSLYSNNPSAAIKSKYENDVLSYGIGFGYTRMLSNKWCVNTGLEWNVFRNKLDYKETTSFSEIRDNVLLSMDVNAITGDTIKQFGTGTVTGKQTRTVIHYNNQKVLTIPVLMSYMIQKKKFFYALGLGPVIHYNSNAEGRTIVNTDQFVNYDKSYFKAINYNLLAKLGVMYQLNKHYLIGLDFSYSTSIGKWNSDPGFSLKRSISGSHLSIAYRF